MIIKQVQIFQLTEIDDLVANLTEELEKLQFTPCTPSMFMSMGWISPLEEFSDEEENDDFIYRIGNYLILCCKLEEKILPTKVIQHELKEKIKQIEYVENRKVGQKEKFILKTQIITKLLPQAFSQFTRIYVYIDLAKERLILGTVNTKKTTQFIALFNKSVSKELKIFSEINMLSTTMTGWMERKDYPLEFAIAKSCVLQDPHKQMRMIRCQQQNLFVPNIQALLKDGYVVKQIALNWQDQIDFTLNNQLLLSSIQLQDRIFEQEQITDASPQQQFCSKLLIEVDLLSRLIEDLLGAIVAKQVNKLTDHVLLGKIGYN